MTLILKSLLISLYGGIFFSLHHSEHGCNNRFPHLEESRVLLDGEDADAVVAAVGDEDVPAGRVDGDAAARVEHVGEGGRDRRDHLHQLQALRRRLRIHISCKDGNSNRTSQCLCSHRLRELIFGSRNPYLDFRLNI